MAQLFANNVKVTSAMPLAPGATLLILDATDLNHLLLPTLPATAGADYFLLTAQQVVAGEVVGTEILKVVAMTAANFLTLERTQEGSTELDTTSIAELVLEMRNTASTLDKFEAAYGWGDHGAANYQAVTGMTDYALVAATNNLVINPMAVGSTILQVNKHTPMYISANTVITLPTSPSNGDTVAFTDLKGDFGNYTVTVQSADDIMQSSEDLIVDLPYVTLRLYFLSGVGWFLI